MTLEEAIRIAVDAHAGKVDKAGKPYVLHPLRVMLAVESDEPEAARIVAVLHDVVEDTEWTAERLAAEHGLGEREQAALRLLTKEDGADYDAYVERLAPDPIARAVKVADLRDNLDVTRLEELGEKDVKRVNKYLRSLRRLSRPAAREEAM